MKYPQACIALFAKAPVPGAVKTRLIPALGAEGACELYLRLFELVLAELRDTTLCHTELWVDSQPEHPAFAGFQGKVYLQQGMGLGARMNHAATQILKRHQQVVLIGTDSPGLDQVYLATALQLLQASCDVVVGPATDGGYVLLGMKASHPQLFAGIEWGSDQVLRQTLARARAANLRVKFLPELADIDRPEDLLLLQDH
jgi:hypothetical protein